MGISNSKARSTLMSSVSRLMAIVFTFVTIFTVFPGAIHAASPPDRLESATAEVSNKNTTVTVTFNTYAAPTNNLEELLSNIQIERSGSQAFVDLSEDSPSNEINMTPEGALVIILGTALTGSANAIHISEGALMNKDGLTTEVDLLVTSIAALDITPPVFTGSSSSNGNRVYLNFDEGFTVNAPGDVSNDEVQAFLKNQLSVSVDGEHFIPVTEQEGEVYQSNLNQIYLNYYNEMRVIIGAHTQIRLAAGTLKDSAGNLNEELILKISPPMIKSATVSGGNHDVTIAFYGDVKDLSDGSLAGNIRLFKGTGNGKSLVKGDTASIMDGKLEIHFAEALAGTANQIIIRGGVLEDAYGNTQSNDLLTSLLQVNAGEVDPSPADTTVPAYLYSYLSNSAQDLNLIFDEDVFSSRADEASFLRDVQWYEPSYGWRYVLPADAVVTFAGPQVKIHFAAPLTGNQYYFSFYSNHFTDAAGNVLNDTINTNWFYPQSQGLSYNTGYFSYDGRQLNLSFNSNTPLVDQTLVDGISHMKEKITLSTDNGITYTALDEQDIVTVTGNRINIFFHKAKQGGFVKIKVDAGVVGDPYDTIRNVAVDATIAYNTPEITGFIFSNTASEFVFADNEVWRSRVQAVRIYDRNIGTERALTSGEYTLSEGKLTIASGVFQKGQYYRIALDAAGYSTKYFEGKAYVSSEIFYITAPVVTAENGITAKINLFNATEQNNNHPTGYQVVVFELFNGSTPVSIVAAHLKLNTGTYSANFNVTDGATNPNYTVKAYVVSKYNADPEDLGLNLATVKTQLELDQAIANSDDNNLE